MISVDRKHPFVSFVIPTHNRAKTLSFCLDSVIHQTYPNVEIIVVNDHSIDNTEEVLREYSSKYKSVRYFNNPGKGGNAARNHGIISANGEYIAFMDDDDVCEPFRIEEQMKPVFESNYFYDFIVSGFTVYANGKITEKINYLKPLDSVGFTVRWLIKKETLIKAGLFDINQPSLQDVEFFWRLKKISHIYFSNKSVVKVMSSAVSITKNKEKMIKGMIRLLDLHGTSMSSHEKNYWVVNICKKYALLNNWEFFSRYFRMLDIKYAPLSGLLLYLSSITRDTRYLKLHSRLSNLHFRTSFIFRNKSRFKKNT